MHGFEVSNDDTVGTLFDLEVTSDGTAKHRSKPLRSACRAL